MNIRGLEALHALVQGGGIAAAAKQVHRTQPQVSRILAQLEDDVGFPLLRKEGRRLILTQDGSEFYRRMMGLLEHKDALQVFSENIRLKRAHRLHIMAANHMVEAFLLDAIIRAHAQRPELSVSINARMPPCTAGPTQSICRFASHNIAHRASSAGAQRAQNAGQPVEGR